MNDEYFTRFLFESESDSLDFKRDQYKFTNASDEEKSKLLKDILAMANSWRQSDGYIVLGVLDKAEKPNELFGITEHIDDAKFQQFVTGKVNRICNFQYKTYPFENKTFGIFKIPVQTRPIYLNKDYGTLKKNIVYVRRGSSTAEANLEEISLMGNSLHYGRKLPELDINIFKREGDPNLNKSLSYSTKMLKISDKIPDFLIRSDSLYSFPMHSNEDYFRDVIEYFNFSMAYASLKIQIENKGDIEAKNLKIELSILDTDIDIIQDGDEPGEPTQDSMQKALSLSKAISLSDINIVRKANKIIIYSSIETLHAKRNLDLSGVIYINPHRKRKLIIESKLYCDGLEVPFLHNLEIIFEHDEIEVTWEDFKKVHFKKKS
ncbi:AlbA family DNA-binding domain-containing protein [Leptospira stimsonii]|uniref:Schlafen AlbA-2 domain-containing protein n=1 Tax=Leptospira stimsonii TaxID=2202203 RepID=A0A396YRJ1_9LEPT|nr:ATP-binding protein [Leptospira stimsonii]RHX83916.1 hypothetical protein DLM75_23515 [Leptospira stimsonii]